MGEEGPSPLWTRAGGPGLYSKQAEEVLRSKLVIKQHVCVATLPDFSQCAASYKYKPNTCFLPNLLWSWCFTTVVKTLRHHINLAFAKEHWPLASSEGRWERMGCHCPFTPGLKGPLSFLPLQGTELL